MSLFNIVSVYFRAETMGKSCLHIISTASLFLVYILQKSQRKYVLTIHSLYELKFWWLISCYIRKFCLVRAWYLHPVQIFPCRGYCSESQHFGNGTICLLKSYGLLVISTKYILDILMSKSNFFSLINSLNIFTKFPKVGIFYVIWIKM